MASGHRTGATGSVDRRAGHNQIRSHQLDGTPGATAAGATGSARTAVTTSPATTTTTTATATAAIGGK